MSSKTNSKKKKSAAAVNAAELLKPSVKTSFDMSLNKDDIVELAVQEQLETLEKQIADKEKEVLAITEELKQKTTEIEESFFKSALTGPKVQAVKEFAKKMDLTTEVKVGSHYSNRYKISEEEFIHCNRSDSELEDHRNPITMFRRYTERSSISMQLPENISGVVKVETNDDKISLTLELGSIRIEGQKRKDYIAALKDLALKKGRAITQLYRLREQRFVLISNPAKIRSKFVKKALEASTEGMEILRVLEGASSVKLLGK